MTFKPKNRLWILDSLVLLAWLCLTMLVVLRHEPWSDEAQPWLVVRDMNVPQFLSYMFKNYDGHPMLWYFLIMPLVKAGLPFVSQQVLHVLISGSALAVLFFKAPFPRITKYAWAFSYLFAYEYAVVSRMYAPAILVLFLIAAFYPRRLEHPVPYALLLFLLFNSENLVLGLAAGLSAVFMIECLAARGLRRFPWPALLILLGTAAILYPMYFRLPPDHIYYGRIVSAPIPGSRPLFSFCRAFIPVRVDVSDFLAMTLAWSCLFFSVLELLKKPAALFILGCGHALLFYIFTFNHWGDVRHHGFFLVCLAFALWIGEAYPKDSRWAGFWNRVYAAVRLPDPRRIAMGILTVCLGLSIHGAVQAQVRDWKMPFSGSVDMAHRINRLFEENHLDEGGFHIVAYPHSETISVLPFMKRKFFYVDLNDFGSFYYARRSNLSENEIGAETIIRQAGDHFDGLSKLLFLFVEPLPFQEKFGYRFDLVAASWEGVWGTSYERFFLYKPVPAV